ncbi:MAG: hypothetical protein OIF50_09070, partial [Flavobacteriaceae bacterium]|nr:hypothetical protein [Flavobacteriaceae bacterium]
NKCMHLAATAYNIKKYLKFTNKLAQGASGQSFLYFSALKGVLKSVLKLFIGKNSLYQYT